MTTELSKTILHRIDGFPALPTTVSKVMAVTGNPDSSAQDLMEAILPDQAMCLTILKIANSAFFGLPRKVSTIDKAVMVLGFNEIRNIILGKAVFNSFREIYRSNRELIDLFWEHSFITGLAAKIIAEELRISASESFIAGLLHDIGKLAMLICLNGTYAPLLEPSPAHHVNQYRKEAELFSISHDEVGYRLLKRWLFPESLLETIGYHHNPLASSGHALTAAVIGIADMMSYCHCHQNEIDTSDPDGMIDLYAPYAIEVWNENGLEWNAADLIRWQQLLLISSEHDQTILKIITT